MSDYAFSGLICLCLGYMVAECVLMLTYGASAGRLWNKRIYMVLVVLSTTSPLFGALVFQSDSAGLAAYADLLLAPLYLLAPPVAAAIGLLGGRMMLPPEPDPDAGR